MLNLLGVGILLGIPIFLIWLVITPMFINSDCRELGYTGFDTNTWQCYKVEYVYFNDTENNTFMKEIKKYSGGVPVIKNIGGN